MDFDMSSLISNYVEFIKKSDPDLLRIEDEILIVFYNNIIKGKIKSKNSELSNNLKNDYIEIKNIINNL